MAEFKLIRELGRGGMGSVWYGIRSDGTECAVKCMLAKFVSVPDYRDFFDAEARAMKHLNHPCVVKIMGDTFTDAEGNLYLPMEYVPGETIEQRIKRTHQPFDEQETIRLMNDILDAFDYIHRQGQIHRDIKPSNIMLRPDGRICVIDFGIAKDMKISTGKTVGRQVGTSGYMSPEQISALNIDHRTDIYSLGCLLFYMLTARHAIVKRTNDYETMYAIQNEEFPSAREINPTVSARMDAVIRKATNKDMRKRYQSAHEFKEVLSAILGDTSAATTQTISEPNKKQVLSRITGKWIVSVGRSGQDINISNDYVSSHHLEIELEAKQHMDSIEHVITLIDHSTNGTGVNGRCIHNGKIIIAWDLFAEYTQQMPDILLAGREECRLDWNLVTEMITRKMQNGLPSPPLSSSDDVISEPQDKFTKRDDNTYVGICIVSFICPIVGWIIYAVNKNDNIDKASKAYKAAWWGFGLGLILNIVLKNV